MKKTRFCGSDGYVAFSGYHDSIMSVGILKDLP